MILVRDVFQLKFGKAREALTLWQEGLEILRRASLARETRLLTDLAGGPYYTLVLESTYDSLADMERELQSAINDAEWRAWYPRFVPLADSGRREVFTIVGSAAPSLPRAQGTAQAARPA